MKTIRFVICVLSVLVGLNVQAATIEVPASQSTIQAGINVAANGDEVVVDPGVYFETINFSGKAITVRSVSANPSDTIINGNSVGSVVTCSSGEGVGSVLSGFTIAGGSGTDGGGMYNKSSSPTVTNCVFDGNFASRNGGGMYNEASSPAVTSCVFDGNSASRAGGGMFNRFDSTPNVTNCTFIRNSVDQTGGGMHNGNRSTITNCVFIDNIARSGGGMSNPGSSPKVTNCIFWENSNEQIDNSSAAPIVTYTLVQGGWVGIGIGNIDVDPLFVDAVGAGAANNLRLQAGSPCIDAGDTAPLLLAGIFFDLDGLPRTPDDPATPNTGVGAGSAIVDMGAYEFQPGGCCCCNRPAHIPGDINCDGTVNMLDLEIMMGNWLKSI